MISQKNQIIFYQSDSGAIELRGDFERDTIWASLQEIADLFRTDKSGISRHIRNIFHNHELEHNATVAKFATVQQEGALETVIGSIFQSFGKKDLYPSAEEKAAHFLYFMVKDHPFIDGNKRSGAFAFIWFLQKIGRLDSSKISPEALTALTLLVAESNPKDKEKIVQLIRSLIG